MQTRANVYYFLRKGAGFMIALFGLLGTGVGILAILDPAGSKMSDDSDPFGTPPSLLESVARTLFYLLITGFGIWLLSYKSKRDLNPTNPPPE